MYTLDEVKKVDAEIADAIVEEQTRRIAILSLSRLKTGLARLLWQLWEAH